MVIRQPQIWHGLDVGVLAENPEYLTRQLVTYIGNKRSRLGDISYFVDVVKKRLNNDKLSIFDAFSGSGVVSRLFKSYSSYLVVNDIEDYAALLARCYLSNINDIDIYELRQAVLHLNELTDISSLPIGFIRELYSPVNENAITSDDRVFYTPDNARRIDDYRRLIADLYPSLFDLLVGSLLVQSSIHVNTSGIFKGFYKDRNTGIGQFGGTRQNALERILGKISLQVPVFSNFECEYVVVQKDANDAAKQYGDFDLAYLDPPYNQHPYGANYFMLNLIVNYQRPTEISEISGIPTNWRRSGYNVRERSIELLRDLIESLDAKFIMISFNDEGFISKEQFESILGSYGRFELKETAYNAFRGSRNFDHRSIHVTEQLFLLEKS